ncbi:MAG: hypothetical protein DRH24_16655 [Deltaproteobacteria bacterium]|nr:MAG: hypothetical protein DRH24_16655 [Deltaproteobacteria bacterium]
MKKKLMLFIHSVSLSINFYFARFLGKTLSRVNKSSNYQPLPWIGLHNSRRSKGTVQRWKAMEKVMKLNGSVLDIGCDVGYFVFKSAERGALAWGVDENIYAIHTANYAKNKIKSENSQFFLQRIDDKNINLLPEFDYIIFLSVFHHWCRVYGFIKAKEMLTRLVKKAKKGLFFEMGQSEMASKYNIPNVEGDFEDWLKNLLEEVSERDVQSLGMFDVFVDKGRIPAKRSMFIINHG